MLTGRQEHCPAHRVHCHDHCNHEKNQCVRGHLLQNRPSNLNYKYFEAKYNQIGRLSRKIKSHNQQTTLFRPKLKTQFLYKTTNLGEIFLTTNFMFRSSFLFFAVLFIFSQNSDSISKVDCLISSISSPTSGISQNNERVFVVKQPATNPATYKQSKQSFREIFKKLVIHVKENTPIGTKLAPMQPTDEDLLSHQAGGGPSNLAQNDRVSYAIIGGADQQSFTLRVENNNEVELVNEINFDYESNKRNYHVIIRATSIFLRYEVEVDIIVEDENDNVPQLDDFAIVFNNYKNNFPTGPIGRVPATDLDINDSLRYRVLSGNNAQLIIVNETTGDIQLSPWLNSNVPLRALIDIAVSDGYNETKATLVLTVNLVTESMLHNSVVLQLDGVGRDEFLSKKYDIFLAQMAYILAPPITLTVGTGSSSSASSFYSINNIVVFDVEESHSLLTPHQPQQSSASLVISSTDPSSIGINNEISSSSSSRSYYSSSTGANSSTVGISISFSARAPDGKDKDSYLSPRFIEERIFLNRVKLSQALDVHVAPFKDNLCVQEPCQNYQECQVTHRFDKASKVFYTSKQMIFRSIKSVQGYTCSCPATFTGMKHKNECNLQINQCFTNPCQNGGTCHRHESGYTCECRGDYFGPNCELNLGNSSCQSASSILSKAGNQMHGNYISTSSTIQPLASSNNNAGQQQVCGGKARCVNLNRSHHFSSSSSSSSMPKSIAAPTTASQLAQGQGFICQACPYPSQWSTELCQLRARSFDKNSYIVLPGLRRLHRFHLSLSFASVQSDALLLYNGRYNDKHDFIALEIVDSRLKFSYSLGGNQIHSVTLSHIYVSNGEWHKVAIDYRDRNVTLLVDDCDPVVDEALARVEAAQQVSRCSNSSVTTTTMSSSTPGANQEDSLLASSDYRMLDLTGPMQVGALPSALINLQSGTSVQQLASLSQSFSGCLSDLHIDHQLVDLGSAALLDFGTQAGCPEKRSFCQLHSCNGFACQDSFSAPKCQCGEERLGRSCELYVSQEKVRRFNGNSYLTFNPIEAQILPDWQASLYFKSINPNGVLFKIILDQPQQQQQQQQQQSQATTTSELVLELLNGGLKLSTHRQLALNFNRLPLDDGEWHHVEISWSGESARLQLDHNPNLMAQSHEMGRLAGSTMRSVIVGSSYTRSSALLSSPVSSAAVLANDQAADLLTSSELAASTVAPLASSDSAGGDAFSSNQFGAQNFTSGSSQNFIGCIFALNVSSGSAQAAETATDWWLSPNEERNVERGCPAVDVCESRPCPPNARCVARGLNQRKCVCQPGFVGHDQCIAVCDLQLCQGDNSRCVSTTTTAATTTTTSSGQANNGQEASLLPFKESSSGYMCECEPGRSGKNCEHQLSAKCPSNWWGKPQVATTSSSILQIGQQQQVAGNASIMCGPCDCDESRGYDGDCDKTTGQCFCKASHYQPPGADYCLACDCYLVGSLSSSCNQTSGQCKCRPGVVGRRCDSCSSPYAEVTLRGCEVIYDACPKSYSDGIWWDKTPLDKLASQQCPSATSTGTATRFCHKTLGWQSANLFDCISNTFTDLYTQYKFLEDNKFQMTFNLAAKIASQLRQALNETITAANLAASASGASQQSSSSGIQLHGSDMYIAFRLLHHLIQHEAAQTGMNLTHRQDWLYVSNIAESISCLLEPSYAHNWPEIGDRSPQGGAEYLLKLIDTYGRILIESQSDTFTQPFEVNTRHFTFGMDTISTEQLYDMSKWAPPTTTNVQQQRQSPPYATDPFDSPWPYHQRSSMDALTPAAPPLPKGQFNADGLSVYLDFSATRDSSPSVVIPKYDNNYHHNQLLLESADQSQATRAIIPLRTLRLKTPRELEAVGSGPLAPFSYHSAAAAIAAASARSKRAKREQEQPTLSARAGERPALVVYSILRTLGPLLPMNYDNSVQNRLGKQAQANSPVVWLTIRPANSSEFLGKNLQPKVTYMLKLLDPVGKSRPQCAIWDFVAPQQQQQHLQTIQANGTQLASAKFRPHQQAGRFTVRGCEIKSVHSNHRLRYKSDYVNCSCDQLGPVVVLMNNVADGTSSSLSLAYSIDDYEELGGASVRDLSLMIALSLSLILLAISLFVLSCIRGHSIKSNSNSINKNLLAILIIIELLVLYSVASRNSLPQLEYQCKLVAIFLHYFSISLFFWLLVNAIHFYRMLTELRDINHGPMKFYHILGYAVPAFFVSLAVGLRIEQFGNYLFCWLSIHEPIIWSMFGPISLASVLTIALFKLALCKSLPLEKDIVKQDPRGADLIKMHMLINMIKTPLIGVYLLLAVYALNEALGDTAALLFPLVVVLKSLILMALLCVLDKYIRYNLYVSWLRFKGEKVPFLEQQQQHQQLQLHYNADGPLYAGHQQQNQWQASLMSVPGEFGFSPTAGLNNATLDNNKQYYQQTTAGQMLLYGGAPQTPGFQGSSADIFRPELFSAFSATSTTSRSTATGSSSLGGAVRQHSDDEADLDDQDELDGASASDYGRSARRAGGHSSRRRRHKKHHHHHHHHHHRHGTGHHHHHHRHHGRHQESGGEEASVRDDYERHTSARKHERGSGHRSSRSHNARKETVHQHHHQARRQRRESSHYSDGLHRRIESSEGPALASSHSSDEEELVAAAAVEAPVGKIYGSTAPVSGVGEPATSLEQGAAAPEDQSNEEPRQTVSMELLVPSTSGQQSPLQQQQQPPQ